MVQFTLLENEDVKSKSNVERERVCGNFEYEEEKKMKGCNL